MEILASRRRFPQRSLARISSVRVVVLSLAALMSAVSCTSEEEADPGGGVDAAEVEAEAEPAAPDPTRHVLVVGLDGLGAAIVSDPNAEMLALLAEYGVSGELATSEDSEAPCLEEWATALREAGEPEGEHVLDVLIASSDSLDVGVFTTSADAEAVVAPANGATVSVGQADVPGLDPWPGERLALDQTRQDATRHLSEVDGESVTFVHSDLFLAAEADPTAEEIRPVAIKTASDMVDLLISSVDARPNRRNEDWLFIVASGCGTDDALLLVEGDGVVQPQSLGVVPDGHAAVAGLIASYVDEDAAAWVSAPEGVLEEQTRG